MADAYGPPCSPGTRSLTPLVREQTILSSPLLSFLSFPPLFRVCVRARARMDVARPRCEAAEITGSLLRPPAANPKEANAMSSSGEQTLAPDKQRTEGEGGDPPDGGEWRRNLYRRNGEEGGEGRRKGDRK